MYKSERGYEVVDWILLLGGKNQRRVLTKAAMKFLVQQGGNLLTI
jgi:hypothetical protein